MKLILYIGLIFIFGCSSSLKNSNSSENESNQSEYESHYSRNEKRQAENEGREGEKTPNSVLSENSKIEKTSDYEAIFKKVRKLLKQSSRTAQLATSKSISELSAVDYFYNHPEKLNDKREELLKILLDESISQKDPTKHLRLISEDGTSGYSELKVFVNHPYYLGNELVKESNLINIWLDFINHAESKIMINIYDFDLKQVAEALVRKANSGVSVTVGIDAKRIKKIPRVSTIYRYLKGKKNLKVVAVKSVNLNHQKIAIADWDISEKSKVLLSSGNLTQSGLGPEGDLVNIPANKRTKKSVPNANHIVTLKSRLLAILLHHQLTMTLDESIHYRGAEYPILGSYQITGPGVIPTTLEAYPENSFIISFSPSGGFKNINQNIIGHFIRASEGPIRMVQFAFSSKDVREALVEKAQQQGKNFDFLSVGDTSFAMEKWSQFLYMSGLRKIKRRSKEYEYVEVDSAFRDVLPTIGFAKLRKNIRIAPWYYSAGEVKFNGRNYPVNAKIHHKILSAGSFAILGSSFNLSDSAQKNNEQILVFKDKKMASIVEGITKWLAEKSGRSVFEEALRRNKYFSDPEKFRSKYLANQGNEDGENSERSAKDADDEAGP
jgi:phosphatidylserine/phosphatidylglycerophosphate/cardiolipin synthase-like enzyme